jgi:uncharacterized protein (DUF2141 family)
MKKFYLAAVLTLVYFTVFSQNKLEINIEEFRNDKGFLMLQLLDENQKVIKETQVRIKNKVCVVAFENLKAGTYAIRYFHDENESGKMDTNLMGKPVEGYGFSNNVSAKFGPPSFDKWLFILHEEKKLMLKPVY